LVVGASSGVGTQTFAMNGPTLTLNGQATVNAQGQFNVSNGTLAGAPVLAGTMNWSGGAINAGSTLTVAPNGVLNISGGVSLYGVLSNAGTVNWSGTGNLGIYNYGD
jgi:hypothetical protein